LKPCTANADPVAQRAITGLNNIEKSLGGVDDDRARRFVRAKENDLALKPGIQLLINGVGDHPGLVIADLREHGP
jgi:hypothetical protein